MIALSAALVLQIAVDRSDLARSSRAGAPLSLLAGALVGMAVLTRPAMLLFLPLAALWLIARRRHVLVVALVAATVAMVAPWTARNYRVQGQFVLVDVRRGGTFWTGNHPLARGEGDRAANPELKRADLEFRRVHPGLSSEELELITARRLATSETIPAGGWA